MKRRQSELELEEQEMELKNLKLKQDFELQKKQIEVEIANSSKGSGSVISTISSLKSKDKSDRVKHWLDENDSPNRANPILNFGQSASKTATPGVKPKKKVTPLAKMPPKHEEVESEGSAANDFKGFVDRHRLPAFTPKDQHSNMQDNNYSPNTSMIKLPKLKIPEFAGDPVEWPEWSSLFLATVDSAPIAESLKMNHLKTLVTGKAKAVISGMGYSGDMYLRAWNALVRNFGRPQLVVNSQLKQLHSFPFINSHDSSAIIKYTQLI